MLVSFPFFYERSITSDESEEMIALFLPPFMNLAAINLAGSSAAHV